MKNTDKAGYDRDLFCIAVRYILESTGESLTSLAKRCGIAEANLSQFLSGRGYIAIESCEHICTQLGADSFQALYEKGNQAAKEIDQDPFDKEQFRTALIRIKELRKLTTTEIAKSANVNKTSLQDFIKNDGYLSAAKCCLVRNALGFKTFSEFYAAGENPDNGIGKVLGSILNQPVYKLGKVTTPSNEKAV